MLYISLCFVDLSYHLVSGEEEEEDFSLLPCVLHSRVLCVCVCACKSSSSLLLSFSLWYQSVVLLSLLLLVAHSSLATPGSDTM